MAGNTGGWKRDIAATGDTVGVFYEAVAFTAGNGGMCTREGKAGLIVIKVVDAE
jgi:hypothetical protein